MLSYVVGRRFKPIPKFVTFILFSTVHLHGNNLNFSIFENEPTKEKACLNHKLG